MCLVMLFSPAGRSVLNLKFAPERRRQNAVRHRSTRCTRSHSESPEELQFAATTGRHQHEATGGNKAVVNQQSWGSGPARGGQATSGEGECEYDLQES